ncbi:NIC-domain-containing protein [Dacryopinax primogenitus]|uniref:Nuclear pore protein n=1 Tax=Dacryopinax primogenitus (strain DJM 731) TaxID=1858805 RepID=M5FSM0_DACPD|nr:NIC-domain-containing protein [Dacryopinax primogenitus]EJT98918.1 NIC-domain-containing protein [Dacryopinax primogenitus]
MATPDLTALLASSRNLAAHLEQQELPHLTLGLDQIENQSRKLVSRTGGPGAAERANYLLAQARVNAPQLQNLATSLNPAFTFAPLQPVRDTDIASHLRHAHEQAILSTIEETRRDTAQSFWRSMEEKIGRDWEEKKKRVIEELATGDERRTLESSGTSWGNRSLAQSQSFAASIGPGLSQSQIAGPSQPSLGMPVHSRMMVYDRVVSDLNRARLQGTPFPIIHALIDATERLPPEPKRDQIVSTFSLLSSILGEADPRSASYQTAPLAERAYSQAYLSPASTDALAKNLRRRILAGSMKWLEDLYTQHVDITLQNNPVEAALGASPSASNKLRAFLAMRYYEAGRWQSNLELVKGQPLWAKIYFLLRCGHPEEALAEAEKQDAALNKFDKFFLPCLREWVANDDRSVSKQLRDRLLTSYNTHIRHAPTIDPFKHALFKLIARAEPSRRNVPHVTETTEDWLWFQLAMADEPKEGLPTNDGLKEVAATIVKFGEKSFDKDGRRPWLWVRILLSCGEFERAVASMHEKSNMSVEAVHIATALAYYGVFRVPKSSQPSESSLLLPGDSSSSFRFDTLIQRYIRHFTRIDPKEALQYVYLITLSSDAPGDTGKEQVAYAHSLCRQIAFESPNYEELLGGRRRDGLSFPGAIEQNMKLLHLADAKQYHQSIVLNLALQYHSEKRLIDAVKLYNLAGEYNDVMKLLIQAIGDTLFESPEVESEAGHIRSTAREMWETYYTTPDIRSRVQDALLRTCQKLLKIREGFEDIHYGRQELGLEKLDQTDLLPFKTTVYDMHRKAEEVKREDPAVVRNLPEIIKQTMEALWTLYREAKKRTGEQGFQQRLMNLREKAKRLNMFATSLGLAGMDFPTLNTLESYMHS